MHKLSVEKPRTSSVYKKGCGMNKRQYIIALALMTIAGFIGGAISPWIFETRSALGQSRRPNPRPRSAKVIRTQRLEVIDEWGNLCAVLASKTDQHQGCSEATLTMLANLRQGRAGHSKIELAAKPSGSALMIRGRDESSGVTLNLLDKSPSMHFFNAMNKRVWKAP